MKNLFDRPKRDAPLVVRFTPEQRFYLRRLAKLLGLSESDIVREGLKLWLDTPKVQQAIKKLEKT